jgi:tight adherence protein B
MIAVLAAISASVCVYLATGAAFGALPARTRARRQGGPRFRFQTERPSGGGALGWSAAVFVPTLAAGTALSGTVRVAVVPALLLAAVPIIRRGRQRHRRRAEIQSAWPDGLRHLVASVRSGRTLPHAVGELAATGPPALRVALEAFPRLLRLLGFAAALESIRARVADPTTDRVIEVLLVAHEAGGVLTADILEDLAVATTADLRAAEEILTAALEQHLNARVVFVLPWLVLVLLTAAEGAYRDFYRSTSAGLFVIGFGAVLTTSGALLVRRLGAVEIEERVLAGSARP